VAIKRDIRRIFSPDAELIGDRQLEWFAGEYCVFESVSLILVLAILSPKSAMPRGKYDAHNIQRAKLSHSNGLTTYKQLEI
jgi:hypothetical protein